jgi:small-conductance mechanosensitive channel
MDTIWRIAEEIGRELLQVGLVLLRVAITVAIAWGVSQLARRQIEPRISRQKYGRDGAILIGRLISIAAYVIAFISVMNQLGVNWTGLLALLSAFTVAIGLSLQDVIKNFFSGILILLERPFSVGDRVKVRDHEGDIQGIDVRTTLIRNTEGALVYVPNSIMFGEILINRSHFRTRRLNLSITDTNRPIADIEACVAKTLGEMSEVRKPLIHPKIVSASPEEVKLRYTLLIQARDDVEHDVTQAVVESLAGATVEVDS